MTFLRHVDLTQEPVHVVNDPAIEYKFPLDIFQKHAISAIDQGHNVLVCAKTGSGKTLVGEYQIAHSLRKGGRVFYTTPIKSLSNQKFHDMKQLYPKQGQVGIMTGDIKYCPDASIVIMTTEILRNLLYKRGSKTESLGLTSNLSLNDLDAVIFDECHYINDKDRGKVWEETMILLDPSVKLILLSATLDKPDIFANWLGDLKQVPIHLIQTQYRVVPLNHTVMLGKQPLTVMDAKELFNDQTYNDWLRARVQKQKDYEKFQKKVADSRRAGVEGSIGGKLTIASFKHQLNETIGSLHEKELLPALAFIFSRKDCEMYAKSVEHALLDSSDSSLAERIFDFHLRHHKTELETISQYHTLRRLIIKGIAFHHSGLLPILKEALEILFSKSLVKLLFCTETFAVGINMPTKTVLFLSLTKYDNNGLRYLRTDEYIQMAGRAGRRGKDTFGTVIYLPNDEPPSLPEMRTIMKGGRPQIKSRMTFHYDFILKSLQGNETTKWTEILHNSYWYKQHQSIEQGTRKEYDDMCEKLKKLELEESLYTAIEEKYDLEDTVRQTTNAAKKQAQRKLEEWKNTHMGPKWFAAETQWKEYRKAQKELDAIKTDLKELTTYKSPIETGFKVLELFGYIEKDETNTIMLSHKGVLASECNESHPFLSVELYLQGATKNLTGEEIVTVLASMIADKEIDNEPSISSLHVSQTVKDTLYMLDTSVRELQAKEDSLSYFSDPNFWRLSTYWIEPAAKWLKGESISALCNEYGLFEGNFVRTILRLANCVEEWISIATYCNDPDTLAKLEDLKNKLVRDVIVPDSLYLHL